LKDTVGIKEIWKVVHSDPQVTFKASNGKFVTYQGANLIANKDKITNTEVFILESADNFFTLKSVDEQYWTVENDTITVSAKEKSKATHFTFQFHKGKVALVGANGKFLSAKPLGGIDAKTSAVGQNEIFEICLLNRPFIVLKTNQSSFIGATDDKVRTNRASPEAFTLHFKDGAYAIQTPQGWYFNESNVESRICAAPEPGWFHLEFNQFGRVAIRTPKGKYLKSENQGFLVATADSIGPTELFEF